jgi:hypothetical protein
MLSALAHRMLRDHVFHWTLRFVFLVYLHYTLVHYDVIPLNIISKLHISIFGQLLS